MRRFKGEIMARQFNQESYREAYWDGWESMKKEIYSKGWEECRDAFNAKYPITHKHPTMESYFFACGEIDSLAAEF